MTKTRTFQLFVVSTGVHDPERFMVYFEQIAPKAGAPFAVDPLLDFYSREDARRIGKLQFIQDIHQVFVPGDQLIELPGDAPLIKGASLELQNDGRQKLNSPSV